MFFAEIYDSIRGRIDCRQKIKPKSDRLLAALARRNTDARGGGRGGGGGSHGGGGFHTMI